MSVKFVTNDFRGEATAIIIHSYMRHKQVKTFMFVKYALKFLEQKAT